MKPCLVCATPIERGRRKGGPLPTYCSTACKNRSRQERDRENGVTETRKLQAREKAERHRAQRPVRPCPYCSDPMAGNRRKQCGKTECVKRAKADRMREYMRTRRADPEIAAKHLEYDRKAQQKRLETVGHWRTVYPEHAARLDAQRRMLIQVATVEEFAPRDVYERDGWACRLCSLPIDPTVAWPDSMSASVDHVVPLSKGGEHSMANTQAAHLGCNSRKGDRLAGRDLA
jgi:5-methylcytosine-specific restriction endonuclease McrA